MYQQLEILRQYGVEPGGESLVLHQRIAAVVGRLSLGRNGIRLGEPRRLALRRAVEEELHAADAEPGEVGVARDAALEDGGAGGQERVGHHVDHEPTIAGGSLEKLPVGRQGGAVLHRREARACVGALGCVELLELTRVARRRDAPEQRKASHLLEHTVGLARTAAPADHTAVGIRRVGAETGQLERSRVHRKQVPRRVGHQDGMRGRDRVEIVASGMAPLRQHRVVVALAREPLARCNGIRLEVSAQRPLQIGDRLHGPDRGGREIGRRAGSGHACQVAVRVDEAREQRSPSEIDLLGAWPAAAADIGLGPQRLDAPRADRERLHDPPRLVQRDDLAVPIQGVSRLRHAPHTSPDYS